MPRTPKEQGTCQGEYSADAVADCKCCDLVKPEANGGSDRGCKPCNEAVEETVPVIPVAIKGTNVRDSGAVQFVQAEGEARTTQQLFHSHPLLAGQLEHSAQGIRLVFDPGQDALLFVRLLVT